MTPTRTDSLKDSNTDLQNRDRDRIFITGLKTQAVIGVFDWEKQFKQPLIWDLELTTDLSRAAQTDALEDTVNYKAICDEIIQLTDASRYDLIEALAERICQHIFAKHTGVTHIQLTLHKPNAIPEADSVGLILERTRPQPEKFIN